MKTFPVIYYFVTAALATIICLLIYATVQQCYRSGANDPQIQMVREMNIKLLKHRSSDNNFKDSIKLNESLLPFLVFYDKHGKPVQSSGYLGGHMLNIPEGVFNSMKSGEQKEITTMPSPDVRLAMVILKISDPQIGFIASGRSLKEVEKRESGLLKTCFMAWGLIQVILLVFLIVAQLPAIKKNQILVSKTVA